MASSVCLNCGHKVIGYVYTDVLGPHMICGYCCCSFDVNVDFCEAKKEVE